MTLEELVRRLIARYGRVEKNGLSMSAPVEDAGVDALALAQIVVYLEAHFGIAIDSREAVEWSTGNHIVASVRHLLAEGHREAS